LLVLETVVTASEVDGLENPKGPVTIDGRSIRFALKGYEPKTFLVKPGQISNQSVNRSHLRQRNHAASSLVQLRMPENLNRSVILALNADETIRKATVLKLDGTVISAVPCPTVPGGTSLAILGWDGCNENGAAVARGMYVLKVQTDRTTALVPFSIDSPSDAGAYYPTRSETFGSKHHGM
jgi:hypothetical protein